MCRYTLGFYDDNPREERPHTIRVKVSRPGLRLSHPTGYAFRSESKKRESLLTAAFIAPGMFERGVVRAHVFPIRPLSRRSWECMVAVEFPLPAGAEGVAEREFAVIIRNRSQKVLSFDRKVRVKARGSALVTRQVSFAQQADLQEGSYTVTAVMGAPDQDRPYTSMAQVVVPPVPRDDVFIVPPVLGKRALENVVVSAPVQTRDDRRTSDEKARHDRVGDTSSFMPLLVQDLTPQDQALALIQVCAAGDSRGGGNATLIRSIDAGSGGVAFRWPPAPVEFEARDGIHCRSFLEPLPVASLAPGDYSFVATIEGHGGKDARPVRAPFTLRAPPDSRTASRD